MEIYQDSMGHITIFRLVFSGNEPIVTCFIITSGGKLPSQLMSKFSSDWISKVLKRPAQCIGAKKPIVPEIRR